MHRKPRDVEVFVTFLPTEDGGRPNGVVSGYRGQFYYGAHDWDGEYTFPDHDQVPLGVSVRAHLAFLSPHEHEGLLAVGTPFLVREGQKVVGYGSVTQLIDLPESAARARATDMA